VLGGLQSREPLIDDLIKQPGLAAPAGQPPRDAWPLGQHDAGAGPVDPIDVMLGIVRPTPRPTVSDLGPEVGTPFSPPAARPDPAFQAVADAPAAVPVAPVAAGPVAMPAAPPMAPPVAPPAAIPSPFAPPSAAAGVAPAVPAQPVFGQLPPTPPEGGGASEAALLRALLRGAGIPEAEHLKSLTPEIMEAVGQILREAVQGTLDLLRARGLMKSEMRADVTMIMAIENNPLKFSPSAEAALAHLLAPGLPGFMPPVLAFATYRNWLYPGLL
jgi:predicted component of type VI protein secretion system